MGRSRQENEFGSPISYNPDFKGPLKGRSCTDIICLLLFVIVIICWIAVGIYALKMGDPDSLLIPKDDQGRRCGHDSEVMEKKYLFFIDITKCVKPGIGVITSCDTKQVCVDKCPEDYFFSEPENLKKILPYCSEKCPSCQEKDIKNMIKEKKCPSWYVPSTPVLKRCIFLEYPSQHIGLSGNETKILKNKITVALSWLSLMVQNTISDITDNKDAQQMVTMVTEDIINFWWEILLGLLGALVICIMYIYLMRWIAAPLVWFSLFGVLAVLSYGVYLTYTKYEEYKDKPEDQVVDIKKNLLEQKNVWLAFLIIIAALLIVALLVLIFLRKRIVIAIALIREGSKAVAACISALFFPLVPWILQLLILTYAVASGLYLASIGQSIYQVQNITEHCQRENIKFKDGDICTAEDFKIFSIMRSESCHAKCAMTMIQNPTHVRIFHAINIFGGLWALFWISAFGEMVLAATFATWYWTFKKSNVPFFTLTLSTYRTLRYHIGTLAFGSLIITICRLIRIAIEYIDHKLKKYDNAFVKAILCCCKCFFWCLENFLKFINKNAYIMCAIHGKNFCASAKDAFSLLMRNILRVFVLDKVTDLLFFMGKILLTGCVGVVAYTVFTSPNALGDKHLNYALVPVVLICIGTFFISNVFFGVYSMAVDTLFLCFLEDCERNDGSPEKPYYMSKDLMKILGKKNKKERKNK